MQYTNNYNIPLSLAVFLATDDYDYDPYTISATSLLKPIRSLILSKRVPKEQMIVDISSLVSARMGSAIHTAIEKAWMNPAQAIKSLGYPEHIVNKVVINPTEVKPGQIPVYMEQRAYKEVLGYKVSGKFDFVASGQVEDFKSTSVYTYLNQTNKDKYILQGSIYRWLNPDIITKDKMRINYVFTDWNKKDSLSNPNYPASRVHTQSLPLMSIQETDNWVRNRLQLIKTYTPLDESELPLCTDEELWRKENVYKYYANPANTSRATKNFNTYTEAMQYYIERGATGLVKEVKGKVTACKYCNAYAICSQRVTLEESGDLVI